MKFGYTILYVADVSKTLAFYEQAFGLQQKMLHENDYGELDTGATTLAFASNDLARSNGVSFGAVNPVSPAPPLEIAFVTNDVAGAVDQAVQAGATLVAEPKQKPWGQTVAYLRDLNGFLIEIASPMS